MLPDHCSTTTLQAAERAVGLFRLVFGASFVEAIPMVVAVLHCKHSDAVAPGRGLVATSEITHLLPLSSAEVVRCNQQPKS